MGSSFGVATKRQVVLIHSRRDDLYNQKLNSKNKNVNYQIAKENYLMKGVKIMATKNTRTERDIYTSMINGDFDPAELAEFATKKLAQLDKRNAKAKERAAEKRAEADKLLEVVFNYVTDEPQSRQDIFDVIVANEPEWADVKLGQVGFRLTSLVNAGCVNKAEASVPGADGKAKRIVIYTLA